MNKENSSNEKGNEEKIPDVAFQEFLENIPPQTVRRVHGFRDDLTNIQSPNIKIYCQSDGCKDKGRLVHRLKRKHSINIERNYYLFIYDCSNCQRNEKFFAVCYDDIEKGQAYLVKVGELPNYGPPTPSKLINLIGSDRELFLKGRKCEIQGLGIAAFAYYRRVIEDKRDSLFDKIIEVATLLDPEDKIISELKSAKNNNQFTGSVEKIKSALPQTLLIAGENPLLLLHSALSQGLHNKSDEECLEYAASVREVLTELIQKIESALSNQKGLIDSVNTLKKIRASR